MATYYTNTTELTEIADAIRAKGYTSGTLEYPDGFVDAIEAIPEITLANYTLVETLSSLVSTSGVTTVVSSFTDELDTEKMYLLRGYALYRLSASAAPSPINVIDWVIVYVNGAWVCSQATPMLQETTISSSYAYGWYSGIVSNVLSVGLTSYYSSVTLNATAYASLYEVGTYTGTGA